MLNVGKEANIFSRPLQKNTPIATQIMVVFIHFTSLAKFIRKTPKQAFLSGGPGIIHCSALGNPSPHFKWSTLDGRSLQDRRFIQLANGSLMMKSIQAEDKGTYICAIKQPRGSEPSIEKSQSIKVIVVGKRSEKHLYLDVLNHQYKIENCHPPTACSHWCDFK